MSSILDNFPHLCSIFRVTPQPDGLGGTIYSVVIEQENVSCWEQKLSSSEVLDYEKRGIKVDTKIYFIDDPQVTERHRILITSRFDVPSPNLDPTDVTNPNIFDVKTTDYPDASAALQVIWKVMCSTKSGATQ